MHILIKDNADNSGLGFVERQLINLMLALIHAPAFHKVIAIPAGVETSFPMPEITACSCTDGRLGLLNGSEAGGSLGPGGAVASGGALSFGPVFGLSSAIY